MAVARFGSIALDCADPLPLAVFWAELIGRSVAFTGEDFAAVRGEWGWLAAVRVPGYRAPSWPEDTIPKQMHLDLAVDDLDEAEAEALRLGARRADVQPVPERYRVLLDPAGHPFCLTTSIPEQRPATPERHMARVFTLRQARALLPDVRRHAEVFTRVRADLVELTASLRAGRPSPLGGVAEVKAAEARLDEILGWFTGQGLELKGFAPLLLDFPADLGDGPVLLCWLEGETDLRWWHHREVGFAGRRPLPDDLA